MLHQIIVSVLALCIIIPVGAFFIGERKAKRFKNMLAMNCVSFFGVLLFATIFMFSGSVSAAGETASSGNAEGMAYLAAALVTGLSTIGAGIATSSAASAGLGALSENDSLMGKALIIVALAEGIAIYGLLVSFMILNKV